ncbi:hypothetical protein ALC60_08495 [Trachymyrmex zeteki]|uniref:Uncharacterized protein n=1 Tax=Mycetomoellerius zeteki TaxID=64791 RepID=A0A151WWS1_9HYME|nr:hypothetical protein ALC60_08495 [Trachymyrmex zeteki]
MDTRSKKPPSQNIESGAEAYDTKLKDLSSEEHELQLIENAIKDRERRIRQHEEVVEMKIEEVERMRRQLDIEREKFNKTMLISRLEERAYTVVEDEPCNTITDFIDLLTGAFGTAKILDQYRGELSIIYLDYISRMKDLRTAILDTARRDTGVLDARFVAEIDGLTARSFYESLPLDYSLQISPETRQHHTDVFAAAKIIAKRQELDKQRSEIRPQEMRHITPMGRPLAYSTPQRANKFSYRSNRPSYPRDPPGRPEYN